MSEIRHDLMKQRETRKPECPHACVKTLDSTQGVLTGASAETENGKKRKLKEYLTVKTRLAVVDCCTIFSWLRKRNHSSSSSDPLLEETEEESDSSSESWSSERPKSISGTCESQHGSRTGE